MNKQDTIAQLDLFARCLEDPAIFANEVLGLDTWSMQDEILRSVFKNRETAVRSCHGSGKTAIAAAAVLAWLRLQPPGQALVVTTSSSMTQVETELWGEIHKYMHRSTWAWPDANISDLKLANGNRAFGLSTDNPTNWHGFHARYVLLILDEAAGIKAEIFRAINGIKASGNVHVLYLMNPTEPTGPSVDLFEGDPRVTPYTVDGLFTPNMEGFHIYETEELNNNDPDPEHNLLFVEDNVLDNEPRDYLIRRRFIRDMYREAIRTYGSLKPESDWWPRVRGVPPKAAVTQLIKKEWIDAANIRKTNAIDRITIAGIDVAGPGKNETAVCVRNGYKIIKQQSFSSSDPYEEVVELIGKPSPNLWVYVDATGIGFGLAAALIRAGYQVVPCNAANRPVDPSRFINAKAEWYWKLREHFEDGDVSCGDDHKIDQTSVQQLLGIRWDQHNTKRLIRIEPKEDAEKRGVVSPDRAEAMMLCFAGGPQGIATGQLTYERPTVMASGSAAVAGGGWASQMTVPTGEQPRAMGKWLDVQEARRTKNYPALAAALKQAQDAQEAPEIKRLIAMMEPAD